MADTPRTLLHRLLCLLLPATGRRRATTTHHRTPGHARQCPFGPPHLPPHSWRRRRDPNLEADVSPLVRPYVVAHEQQQRRRALALALDGIDIGPWIIHGVRVGGGAL